jgi:hypothetical protein
VYVPNWTSYGWGDQYILSSDDGQSESTGFIQQASHGSWVPLFGSHRFTAGQDYTVQLTQADTSDSNCHYQMADQMKWVYDGPSETPSEKEAEELPTSVPVNAAEPTVSGTTVVGQTLTEHHGQWDGSPTSYRIQWELCTSALSCVPIAGATSASYQIVAADATHTLRVSETAVNAAGSSAAISSAETAIVSLPPFQPEQPCTTAAAHAASAPHGLDLHGIGHIAAVDPGRVARARSKKRHHGTLNLSTALRETVGTSRHFTIHLGLTPAVKEYLGETCPRPLTGTGTVNFKRRTALWTVQLPPGIGGHVSAFADRRVIYVSSPLLGSSHRWVALRRPSDYVALDRIPLLRDIVAASDPLGSLSLLNSAHTHLSAHAHRHRRGRRASLASTASASLATLASDQSKSISTSCNNGQQVSDGSDNGKRLTDTLSVGTTAESDMLTNWVKNKISAEATQDGLCEVKVSLENVDNNGFDITIEFSNPVPPAHISAAGVQDAVTYTQTYHFREACYVGMWEGEDKAFVPGVTTMENTALSSSTGTGTVKLSMTQQQTATLYTDEVFNDDYTHPSVEFITLPNGDLGTEEVPLTVPSAITRKIEVSGPVTLTGEDGMSLELTGRSEVTVEAPPFTIDPGRGPAHLNIAGTLTCPTSSTLSDLSLGEITLHKTSNAPGLPVLTKAEQSWQQQLQALPSG